MGVDVCICLYSIDKIIQYKYETVHNMLHCLQTASNRKVRLCDRSTRRHIHPHNVKSHNIIRDVCYIIEMFVVNN